MTSSPIRLTSELVPFEQPSSPVHFEDEEMPQREDIRQAPLMEELIDAQNLAEVQKTYIWGTTVTVKDTYNGFRNFLEKFKKDPASKPHYLQILEQMKDTEITNFNLDCQNLYEFERDHVLYYKLINYPQEVIPIFDMVVHDLFRALFPEVELRRPIQVRTFNLKETRPMRELNPEDIDKLISVKGMIIRHSNIIPDLKTAFFKCVICEKTEVREVDRGRIVEPNKCPNCQSKGGMALIHNRGLYSDKQVVKLQETPESIPEGGTPQTVNLAVYDDLVDVTRPGDRIRVTGIYRAQPVRTNQGQRAVKHVYRTYIDVIHFHLQDAQRTEHDVATDDVNMATSVGDSQLHDDTDELDVNSEEKINKFRQFGQLPDVYERLVKSFAPSIHELDDIKKGILCQLFGGTNKKFAENSGKFRGEINVLLCGDPGMSKSQLLQYVHKIAPRGIYTSGKGSSAVGLTAYITKDPDTGEAVLESGALVLSDRGICCIDEFDKMSDQTRAILHEAMEQQTVSVAKAGIICSLNARTAILASANPRDSKYNPNLSVVDNIQLPPTLLSRFDLIYLILDKPDPNSDRKLARHLVSLYFEDVEEQLNGAQTTPDDHLALAPHELKQYIAWSRKVVQPQLSDEALEALVEGYVQLRRVGGSSGHGRRVIAATPRQLEGLIRLSEALAKMNLSNLVTARHVTEALRLTRLALLQAATDPRSGLVDIDLITTGRSAVMRARVKQLANEMKALLDRQQAGIKYDMLYNTVQQQAQNGTEIPREDFEEALHMLLEEESITISGNDKSKTIRRVVQG